MLPPPFAGELFRGITRYDLIEHRLLALLFPQDTPEPLDILLHRACPREDNADVGCGDIHTLVEDLARHHGVILAGMEAREDLLPLLGLRLMRNRRNEKSPGDGVDRGVVSSEDDDPVRGMLQEQVGEFFHLGQGGAARVASARGRPDRLPHPVPSCPPRRETAAIPMGC